MEKREAGRLLCDFLADKKIPGTSLELLSPADWQCLADRALRFKVEGLLYHALKSLDFPALQIPDEIRNSLRKAYRNQATLNASLFFDAVKVLKSLAENHLPVIALKGLALAKSIYGDIALRPMSDIDLLLREKDLVNAGRILLALGYQQSFPDWESSVKAYHHLPPFTNKNGAMIELHWNIVTPDSPIKVDLDGLWERARFIKVDDVEVLAFSPEDLFLHLCIHAGFHLQTGLDFIPFCDLAGLIKTSAVKINWQTVVDRAALWGGQKCVYLMLLLVRELLAVAPSDEIMTELKSGDYQPAFFAEALEQIFDEKPSGWIFRRRVGKLAKITKVKGISGKVAAFLNGVFPSREYLARMYPVSVSSPKIYLFYLSRLGRLFVYFISVLLRFFRRDPSVIHAFRHEQKVSAVSDWMFSK
jgi:hypothetical protein